MNRYFFELESYAESLIRSFRLSSAYEAFDIVNPALMTVYYQLLDKKIDNIKIGWVKRTMRNITANTKRDVRDERFSHLFITQDYDLGNLLKDIEDENISIDIERLSELLNIAIDRLDEPGRFVIINRNNGLSNTEIATMLNKTSDNISQIYTRAKKQLCDLLGH
jgi:RNA polymerase sigma factor (sigma-70 family)